ncbi:hypothetical protein JW756_05120 [Candidatus Woesearchaeota archaeon]|nr:hypothetical protein [Candidatus Woesearchaeota archaeon]
MPLSKNKGGIVMKKNLDYYLICPVRNIANEVKKRIDGIVETIEAKGEQVHYPPRDVNQDDPVGLRICSEHSIAMKNIRKKVIMWYDPASHGSMFDVGMLFMEEKPLEILNPESIENITNDYEQFLTDYSIRGLHDHDKLAPSAIYLEMEKKREYIKNAKAVPYRWVKNDWEALFEFGMIFVAGKQFTLLNKKEVKAEADEIGRKCYQKVLVLLDDMYRKE